jgi:hypothetical protein
MLVENRQYFISGQRLRMASTDPRTGMKPRWVVPDAVEAAMGGFKDPRYPEYGAARAAVNSAFIEVKAVHGTIGLSHSNYQILGMIEYLAKSSAASGSKGADRPFPTLYFVTTSDTIIGRDVLEEATGRDVVIWQSITYTVKDNIVVGTPTILNPEVFQKHGISVSPTSPYPVVGPTGPLHSPSSVRTPDDPDPTTVNK